MHLNVPSFLHSLTLPPGPAGPPTPMLALVSRLGSLKPRVSFGNANLSTSPLALLVLVLG